MSKWLNAFLCETGVAESISSQAKHGVNFNQRLAHWLVHTTTEKILALDRLAVPQMPRMMNVGNPFNKPFLKSGKLQKWVAVYCDAHEIPHEDIGGPFTRVWYTEFDMSKTDRVKDYLIEHGWKPDEWNTKNNPLGDMTERGEALRVAQDVALMKWIEGKVLNVHPNFRELVLKELGFKGKRTVGGLKDALRKARKWPTSPKITESSFDSIEGTVASLVKQRVQYSHRRSLVQGLIKNIRPDGKLSAEANPDATPTHRMRHKIVVNIPAGGALLGRECRSMFIGDYDPTVAARIYYNFIGEDQRLIPKTNLIEELDKGKWVVVGHHKKLVPAGQWDFVGYDGAGLELRMLAHYMNDEEYTHQILHGDIHTHNQKLAGLPTRKSAKSFIYAHNYGAGDMKLGSLVGGGKKEGALMRSRFMAELPGLSNLIARIQKQAEKGYITGIDGRLLVMRKDAKGNVMSHKALNTLLQAAGSVVMKYANLFLSKWVKNAKLRAYKVLDVHDEGQWTCHPADTKKLMAMMEKCVAKAGEYLKLNIPLASDAMVGCHWYDTH